MGFCSYCYQHAGSSYGRSNECFSWTEAKGCRGITGPDDPKVLAAKQAYYKDKARELHRKADKIEAATKARVKALRDEANSTALRALAAREDG